MTEFKKGDRVVCVMEDEYFGVEMPEGTLATYDDDDPTAAAPRLRLDTGERVRAWRDYIAHAEDPAPLDPAAVNEFKKGDRIVFVEDDHYAGVEMPAGTLATYDDDAPTGGLVRWVRLDTGERVAAGRRVIAPAEPETPADVDMWAAKDALQAEVAAEVFQTPAPVVVWDGKGKIPTAAHHVHTTAGGCVKSRDGERCAAPLDPKAVKPGDMVTLSRGNSTARGAVTHVQDFLHLEELGRYRVKGLGDGTRTGGYTEWTLTDHQPAPEPEPEWEEGVIYLATNIHNGYRGPVLYDAMRGEGGSGLFTFILSEDEYDPTDLRDVRPAVVIDPADVDVDMLVDTAHNNAMTKREVVEHVLGTLGIEVPR